MNNILKVSLIVLAGLVIAGGLFFAGSMFGNLMSRRMGVSAPGANSQLPGNGPGNPGGVQPNQNGNSGIMPGQRGGLRQGQQGGPMQRGGGRMGGRNGGPGMGGWMSPGGMMQGQNITPLTADEAKKAAQDYITSLKIDGLEVGEVLTFNTNAYVVVKETATGNGAFELMVDPFNKIAHPLMGPASAWNLKYGGVLQANRPYRPMMMGQNAGATATPAATPAATAAPAATPADISADMPISADQAIKDAQTYLDAHYAGTTAATTAFKFYGYYTIDFLKDGKVIGKLSVNGYNGQVVGRAWRGIVTSNP